MLLKRLVEADALPGQEGEVRDILKSELETRGISHRTDALGNLVVRQGCLGPSVMLAAHMDEVGLIVTGYEKTGLLRVRSIGGIDERILVSKVVRVGQAKIPGVVGAKAIHLQEPEEREKPIKIDNLFVDIGASNKEEAQRVVKLGDGVAFASQYEVNSYGVAKGKAFDDRAGCAVVIDALAHSRHGLMLHGVFTAQEEVGARGATVAAHALRPDFAVVVECTTANDVVGEEPHLVITRLGRGPAITFADGNAIVNPKAIKALVDTAEAHSIPYQLKQGTTGGTDGGHIATSCGGVPTVIISMPCRYMHSPVAMMSLRDFEATSALVCAFIDRLAERGLPV